MVEEIIEIHPIDASAVQQRQHFYFLARKYLLEGEKEEAINAYKEYSACLKEEDQHIPHLWISKLYSELENQQKSLEHLVLYAIGCSPPKSAVVYKEAGKAYDKLGQFRNALDCYNKALGLNPKIGLRNRAIQLEKLF